MQALNNDIIIKAAKGDIKSFEAIYRQYSGFVYNIALRIMRNKQDADEITQEVFIKLFHKLAAFKFESSFKTWIYRVAVNAALNYAKKLNRENKRMVELDENLFRAERSGSVDVNIENKHNEHVVNRLLAFISPEQRTCIVLRHIEGLSYEEISEVLKVNINTVRTRLKRAREKLMDMGKEVMINEVR